MNERQRRFADEFIKLGNATQAAINAGYSEKYAGANADKLLKILNLERTLMNSFPSCTSQISWMLKKLYLSCLTSLEVKEMKRYS